MALIGHVNMAAYLIRHVRVSHQILRRFRSVEGGLYNKGSRAHHAVFRELLVQRVTSRGFQQQGHRLRDQLCKKAVIINSVIPVRWNSNESTASVINAAEQVIQAVPEGYIPEPPPIPVQAVPEVTSPVEITLNALGEPTLTSLGLAHWTPPGFIQSALEMLHVSLDLPWWGAIVAGTVVLRMCLFPLVILAQRNSAQMSNHMPTISRLQEKFTRTRMSGNPLEAAQVAHELQDYMKRNDVKPMRNMLVPLAQMPIFVSVFMGVRGMANLPVESMTTGGLLWIPDLTVPDPMYLLPVITMATLLATIELGVDGVRAETMSHTIKWVMRGMPIVLLPFIFNFPSAMLCYWFTSNTFSLFQVLMLKGPMVREFFKIPQLVKHTDMPKAKSKGFTKGFKETWSNSKLLAEIEDRQRMDEQRWRESGQGPLQKTYSYDPTKVKPKNTPITAKPK